MKDKELDLLKQAIHQGVESYVSKIDEVPTQEALDFFANDLNLAIRAEGLEPPGWITLTLLDDGNVGVSFLSPEEMEKTRQDLKRELPLLVNDLVHHIDEQDIIDDTELIERLQLDPDVPPDPSQLPCLLVTSEVGPCGGIISTYKRAGEDGASDLYMRMCEQHFADIGPSFGALEEVKDFS